MSNDKFKICFFGTPLFSVPSLEQLHKSSILDISAVVTQQDKPAGRGRKELAPPVKQKAIELGYECLQPKTVNTPEFCEQMRALNPDLFIVIAFGQIFKPEILAIPRYGCVNAHASLLPNYRGAAPIQAALMNGDKVSGTSTIFMNERMDAGNIILKEELPIEEDETSLSLAKKLANQSALLLEETIKKLIKSPDYKGTTQDEARATFTKKISRETGRIDWNLDAYTINNLVRAMAPSPGAFGFMEIKGKKKSIKLLQTRPIDNSPNSNATPGTIVESGKDALVVATGNAQALLIRKLQPESGKVMDTEVFLRGHPIETGTVIQSH